MERTRRLSRILRSLRLKKRGYEVLFIVDVIDECAPPSWSAEGVQRKDFGPGDESGLKFG